MSASSTQEISTTTPSETPANVDGKEIEIIPYEILSRPSKCIKIHQKTLTIDNTAYELVLITMRRTFLLSINNLTMGGDSFPGVPQQVIAANASSSDNNHVNMSEDELISCFLESNSNLKGLSIAIGDNSTCLIESDNSLASNTLAIRLSKKLNLSRPVYVSNNLQVSQDVIELSDFMSKLYMKIFQFVSSHYNANIENSIVQSPSTKCDQNLSR